MSEEQLTVAELLARSGKSQNGSRRRRRRSLDEGGISVAELTGSIPKVTEKPEDARHTTHPIDADDSEQTAPQAEPVTTGPEVAAVTHTDDAETGDGGSRVYATEAKRAEPGPVVSSDVPDEETRADDGAEEEAGEFLAADSAAADANDTMVLRVFTDGESAPLTTGSFPVVDQHTEAPKATKSTAAPVHTAEPSPDTTSVLPKVVVDEETTPARLEQDDDDDDFFPDDSEDAEDYADADFAERESNDDADVADGDESDEKPSIAGIVVTALVAFIVGVLVFYAFMSLWASSLMPLIVIVLALVVTVAIGVAVHSLKTGKDTLTTVLATITGLVLTFGPALVTGL